MKPTTSSSTPSLPKLSKSAHRRRRRFNNQLKRLQDSRTNCVEDRNSFHFCARTGRLVQRTTPLIRVIEKETIPVTDPDLQSLSFQPMIETFIRDPYQLIRPTSFSSSTLTIKVPRPQYPLPSVRDLDKPLPIPLTQLPSTIAVSTCSSSRKSLPRGSTSNTPAIPSSSKSLVSLPFTSSSPCEPVEAITASLPTLTISASPNPPISPSCPTTFVPLDSTHADSDTESASSELDHPPSYENYYNDRPFDYQGPIPPGFIKRTPSTDALYIASGYIPITVDSSISQTEYDPEHPEIISLD